MLHLLQVLDPLLGTADHLLKLQPLPQRLVQPVGDGRRQHADNAYLDALAVENGVGLHVGILGLAVNDVGAEGWTSHFANPLVVHLVARLDVVVTHRLCVEVHVVDDAGGYVLPLGHDEVRPVAGWLSLQNVAIVNEQQVLAVFAAQLLDVCVDANQRALQGLFLHEVIREEMPVDVAGLYDSQLNGFGNGHSG